MEIANTEFCIRCMKKMKLINALSMHLHAQENTRKIVSVEI